MDYISIALDGPAGAGKSTIAKMIAKIKNLIYIDTGAMYRAITLAVIKKGIQLDNARHIDELLVTTNITFCGQDIFINGQPVTQEIRMPQVNQYVSSIAKIPEIRNKMVEIQRKMATNNNVIMDGRDIGTNVLPNATYKFFLTASLNERASRRYEELKEKGYTVTLAEVKEEIQARDKIDSERKINPLQVAKDAIIIDTTDKSIEQVVKEILSYTSL